MNVPPILLMTAVSTGHPYVLNDPPLPVGYLNRTFDGRRLPENWQPPAHTVERKSGSLADAIAWDSSFPLFSEKATKMLGEEAGEGVEFRFFTEIRNARFFVMNVLASADVLDEERSEGVRGADGVLSSITRHVFKPVKPSALPPVFKLPGRFHSSILVTASIPDRVIKDRLRGFQFRDPGLDPIRDLFLGNDVNVVPGVLP